MSDLFTQQQLAERLQELMEEAVNLGFVISVVPQNGGSMVGEVRLYSSPTIVEANPA